LDEGNLEAATEILENEVVPRALKGKSSLQITDSCSLLMRMDMDNPEAAQPITSKHWQEMYKLVENNLKDHISAFNDSHYMLALIGSKHYAEAEEMIKDLEENFKEYPISGKECVLALLKAILAYGQEDYRTAVDLLIPIRYKIVEIGGSDAQRDVFYQLIITAALKSDSKVHRKLVEHLIMEREAQKPESGLNRRMRIKLNN